jgi:hypothetical protein
MRGDAVSDEGAERLAAPRRYAAPNRNGGCECAMQERVARLIAEDVVAALGVVVLRVR